MKANRPVNLDLMSMSFPITAIVSILHRISGVVLFLFIPFALWLLEKSLCSELDFFAVQQALATHMGLKLVVWAMTAAFLYHFIAGVRHLLMDNGIGDTLQGGRLGAKLVMLVAVIAILVVGVLLW